MDFKNLKVSGWRQFDSINIDFHPRLTILAGANGAGKSTLLRILSQHFGYSYNLIATPTIAKNGVLSYLTGLFGRGKTQPESHNVLGSITYSNNVTSPLVVPESGKVSYTVGIQNQQQVEGLFINSHRPVSNYQAIASIPTNAIGVEQAYQAYSQEVMNKYNNAFTQYSPIYRIKEAIISMATFGPGNRNVQRNSELEKTYDDFKAMLTKVLPDTIGFTDISIRIPDIVIVTKTGEFVLDASSGGLMALIDMAWQMFLFSRGKSSFVGVIDEPENHLHPSMQRVIIGNLLDAFPKAQLIVATHSPFVVSSVRESSVYVLRYADSEQMGAPSRSVYSEKLENVNKAGTASEILRSVLGVPVTLPLWAENQIESIVQDFDITTLDAQTISQLRARLEQNGLGDYYSDALGRMSQRR
ncbi:AAA family ATPase [Agrobacterium tumefaciens]|uniref:AAA family ATPase n=1 Tax=Agrobacterium tumefaciens TaxID=358 RepID=UPI001572B394|nr:AAA family ATPase [Agrobacterium tumefaciens]